MGDAVLLALAKAASAVWATLLSPMTKITFLGPQ